MKWKINISIDIRRYFILKKYIHIFKYETHLMNYDLLHNSVYNYQKKKF